MNSRVFSRKFVVGLLIYVVCFGVIAGVGLGVWWDFIENYELSRPKTTVKAYVDQLTPESIASGLEDFLSGLDSNVQSREESIQVLAETMMEPLTFAKMVTESTEDRYVYALLLNKQEIGQLAIQAQEAGKYGLRMWNVVEATYDLSCLIGEDVVVTVPEDFTVCVGKTELDSSYIMESGILYPVLEDFEGKFDLPAMVTYQVDGFLGNAETKILDRDGNVVQIAEDTNMNSFLPECSEQEMEEIDAFVPVFIEKYVNYSGGAKYSIEVNFKALTNLVVPDGELYEMFYSALRGLRFAASRSDTVQEITIHQYAALGNNRYLCDLTFDVLTVGRQGEEVHTENNMKLILLRTEKGLKAESLIRY